MGRRKRVQDDELLAVARDAFVQEGFGASTRTIAQRAGVSEAVLFQRFRTKPELFFAAMVPPAPDLHAILTARSPREKPSRRLEEIALSVLAYFREVTPILVPLLASPGFSYERFVEQNPDSPIAELVSGLQAWATHLEAAGLAMKGTHDSLAITLVGSMAGLALFERMGAHDGTIDDRIVRDMARLLWRGLTPMPPGGSSGGAPTARRTRARPGRGPR